MSVDKYFKWLILPIFLGLSSTVWADEQAYRYLNQLRDQADMSPYQKNALLEESAQNHALYLAANQAGGHQEQANLPHFTGVDPEDRSSAVGYKSLVVSENVSSSTKPDSTSSESIDDLMSAIYHRFGFLDFYKDEIGIGTAKEGDYHTYVYNMSTQGLQSLCAGEEFNETGQYYQQVCAPDIKIAAELFDAEKNQVAGNNPLLVHWPTADAKNIPPAFFEESPDPLPDYSVSGYPISLQFNPLSYTAVTIDRFEIYKTDDRAAIQPTRLLDKAGDPNGQFTELQFALFPLSRLDWNTTYRVEVDYSSEQGAQTLNWEFTTRDLGMPIYTLNQDNETLTIDDQEQTLAVYVPPQIVETVENFEARYDAGMTVEMAFIDSNTVQLDIKGKSGQQAVFSFNGGQFTVSLNAGEEETDSKIPETVPITEEVDPNETDSANSFLDYTPKVLNFGDVLVDDIYEDVVTLTNTGETTLTDLLIEDLTGEFTYESNCDFSLGVDESCDIAVAFAPSSEGDFNAELTIWVAELATPITVPLSGKASTEDSPEEPAVDETEGQPIDETATPQTSTPETSLTLSTQAIEFNNQGLKTTSLPQTVTVTNNGEVEASIKVTVDGEHKKEFSLANNTCKKTLPAGESCQIDLTFKPGAIGDRTAQLTVTSATQTNPQSVSLTGQGVAVTLKLSASEIDFKKQAVGETSAKKKLTLENVGTDTITDLEFDLVGEHATEFSFTTTCGNSLKAEASCDVELDFSPTQLEDRQAQLNIVSSADTSPDKVLLVGTGKEGATPPTPEVTYPTLGNASALNAQGELVDAPNISFAGGIAIHDAQGEAGEFADSANISLDQATTIQGQLTIPKEQVGKMADFFAVGFYSPTSQVCSGRREDGLYYMMTEVPQNSTSEQTDWHCPWGEECGNDNNRSHNFNTRAKDFVEWNGEIDSLQAFKQAELTESMTLDLIVNSQFNAPGLVCVTFGYQLLDTGLLYFHDHEIEILITEDKSL